MLRDFHREERVVVTNARRIIVRKPTVETVSRFTLLFGEELERYVTALSGQDISTDVDSIRLLASRFCDTERAADVLSTCCELHDGRPGELQEAIKAGGADLIVTLYMAALSTMDWRRVWGTLGLPQAIAAAKNMVGADDDPPEYFPKPSPLETLVLYVAKEYEATPFEVMRWPYEAVMSLASFLSERLSQAQSQSMKAATSFDIAQLRRTGIAYRKSAKVN